MTDTVSGAQPVLFSSLGAGDKTALESSAIVGAVNVLSTLVAVFGVDRFGRRKLLLEAGFQMFITELIVAILLGMPPPFPPPFPTPPPRGRTTLLHRHNGRPPRLQLVQLLKK